MSKKKVVLTNLEFDVPEKWGDQGMITLTIPSTDKNVRPNIIITKERLAQKVDLATYFAKIKDAVKARGIESFKILDERQIEVGGLPAMQMVCAWDLEAMKQMLGDNPEALKNIQPGQNEVQQIQVSFIIDGKGEDEAVAVNVTASFPASQFQIYSRPFQQFLNGMKCT